MDFKIPGTFGPTLTAKANLIGSVRIFANGVELPRDGWIRSSWSVPATDGRTYELRLARSLMKSKLRVGSLELTVERPLARVMGMLTITLLAALVLGAGAIAFLMLPVPEYAAGTCYQGFEDGDGLANGSLIAVDCSAAHESEVVANIEHPDGPYPGADALFEYGERSCRAPFEAYVGIAYDDSTLSMVVASPDDILWLMGDRAIDCFVVSSDDSLMERSVRDQAR